jgi:hypothetical protein
VPARSQLAFGNCFGAPARQTESVYSAPCAPAFRGDNGGATGHNVFPNEVRLGFWHVVGAPSTAGKVPDTAQAGESAETRTFRVLEDYFNRRYQTWGRRVQFYALAGGADPAENQALVRQADSEYHLFGAYHLNRSFCEPFVRDVGPMMCNPERHEVYLRNRPNMFSFMMDRTQASGFGAEFLCKNIIGKPARFAGERLRGRARKVAVLTQNAPNRGISPEVQVAALKKECGASFNGGVYELDTDNDPSTAAALVTRMLADGVTSVVLETELINTLYVMTAAQSQGFVPEWMIFNANGLDFNGVAQLLPPSEAVHLFGLTAWEVPRRLEEQECYQAYRSIDPDNEPNANTCTNFWHPMVMLMNGIQQAGPKLSAKSFAQGLEAMGYRYPVEPWAIGGGYGPDDYSYMDNMSEIWFSGAAKAPENDQPGAFVWAYQAKRFKRGQIPTDDSELFRNGVTTPNGPQVG